MKIIFREYPPDWPKAYEPSEEEKEILSGYSVRTIDVASLEWMDEQRKQLCRKSGAMGIYAGDRLLAIARRIFCAHDTKIYMPDGSAFTVICGAVGEEFKDYSRSILAVHNTIKSAVTFMEE